MFVVKRPFRNFGSVMAPGSIVEPGAIKHFRSLLSDNHIIEVNEQNFTMWNEYFNVRYGVQLKPSVEPSVEPSVKASVKASVKVSTKANK